MTFALDNLGGVLEAEERLDEAVAVLQDALARARRDAGNPILTADILSELAVLLKNLRRNDEAEPMYKEALALRQQTFGDDHPMTSQSHNNYGVFLRSVGRPQEALPHQQRALAADRARLGENHRDVAIDYTNLAGTFRALDRNAEAETAYRSALHSMHAASGPTYWVYGNIEYNYGTFLRDLERTAEAERLMTDGYAVVRDGLGASSQRARAMAKGLAEFYEKRGRTDLAAEYRTVTTKDARE